MKKNFGTESREFNALKKIGFEFGSPQDGFSYQPDSGSIANGLAAKQEYGIDVDTDAFTAELQDQVFEKEINLSDIELTVPDKLMPQFNEPKSKKLNPKLQTKKNNLPRGRAR